MALCKFSSSYIISDKTIVDNVFINDFLPYAPELCVKVYLLGLNRCSNATAQDNNLSNFANVLNVAESDIVDAFKYWQEQGLVQIIDTDPIEVRFLPLNTNLGNIKKYKIGKYNDFNIQVQEILNKRMITPTEFSEYYNIIENYHMTPEALLMVIKYCADLKGDSVRHPYITTVAKDWANDGIFTADDVEKKISTLGIMTDKIALVFQALGTKRKAQIEDIQMLNHWINDLDFELNVIVYIAKMLLSKKQRVDMELLNKTIQKYYEMRISSVAEIENYETEKQHMYEIAQNIVKGLGLYYQDLTVVIDTYVSKWLQMGYTEEVLYKIRALLFAHDTRTLSKCDETIKKFYKLGIVSNDALDQYIAMLSKKDENINNILKKLSIVRNVNNIDREYYTTWTENWNFSNEMIDKAIELSKDQPNAMAYLNKILANWKSEGINSVDKIKSKVYLKPKNTNKEQKYSKDEINSLFSNLDEVEV